MDPITTIIFATTVALGLPATRAPVVSRTNQSNTEYTLDRRNAARTSIQHVTYNEPVYAELLSYKSFSDGWDGEGSVAPSLTDIEAAIAFVEMAVDYLPTPGAMLSPQGQVGLYWNTPSAYIDINFDSNGTISIYSRNRRETPNAENFVDNLDPRNVQTLLPIMEVLNPMKMAA